MKRMKKILTITGIVVVALIAALFVFLTLFLSSTIKQSVETIGPRITGTTVTLDDVDVRPFSGHVSIKGLAIGNPEGFKTKHLMQLREFRMRLDPGSVFSDRIHIYEILIDSPEITYEVGLRGSNVGALLDHLEGEKKDEEPKEKPKPDKKEKKAKEEKKVLIDSLAVNNGRIRLSVTALQGGAAPIPLPSIELKDIGKDPEEDATITATVIRVFKAILSGVGKAVVGVGGLAADGAMALGGAAASGAKIIGSATADGAMAVGGVAADGAKAIGGAAAGGAKAVGGVAADGAKAIGGAAADGAKAVGGAAAGGAKAVGGAAAKGVGSVVGGVKGLFGGGKGDTNAPPAE